MGDPVVFIPGFMCDARAFLPQIVHLGWTHAATVFVPGVDDSVERLSERLLDIAPPHFVLVGHGLGGDVAIDVLRRAPERVLRVVLISTDPLAEPPKTAAAREARIVAAKSGRLREALAEEWPEAAFAATEWRDEVRAVALDMGMGLGEGVFIRQSRAMQRRPDQSKTLRRALMPALILAGAEDQIVPVRRQEVLAGLLPHGRLQVVAAAGNLPMLEQPEAVSAALEAFLSGPMMLRPVRR
ncbi:MAG: hypothetical protein RIR62_2024 [Pseudomonadota bacterium]|jgi:pimeloyl-ACP methyl ester carboxylesterase